VPVVTRADIDVRVTGAQQAEASLGKVGGGLVALNQGAELAKKGIDALGKAFQFVSEGARINDVARAFERMGGTAASLERMSAALGGAVSDAQVRRFHNMAVTLGIGSKGFERLIPAARSAAQSLGLDMTYALESVVTGVARGSKQWLDNLGIIVDVEALNKRLAKTLGVTVDQLTAQQKTQALVNEVAGRAGPILESQGDAVGKVAAAWANFKDGLKSFLAENLVGRFSAFSIAQTEQLRANAGAVNMLNDALRAMRFSLDRISDTTDRSPFAALGEVFGEAGATVAGGADAIDTAFRKRVARQRALDIQAEEKARLEAAKRAQAAWAKLNEERVTAQQAIWDSIDTDDRQRTTERLADQMAADEARIVAANKAWQDATDAQWSAWESRAKAAFQQVRLAGGGVNRDVERGKAEGAAMFAGADLSALGIDSDTPGGVGQLSGYVDALVEATDATSIFTRSAGSMFRGMSDAIGESLAAAIINGESFSRTWRRAAASVLESISIQAFSQAAYLAAIAPVAGVLLPGIGAAVALKGAAALAIVGTGAAIAARGLGGTARESTSRAAAGTGGVGGFGARPDVARREGGPTTIVVRFGISRSAVHQAVVEESGSTGRGGVRVVVERAA